MAAQGCLFDAFCLESIKAPKGLHLDNLYLGTATKGLKHEEGLTSE